MTSTLQDLITSTTRSAPRWMQNDAEAARNYEVSLEFLIDSVTAESRPNEDRWPPYFTTTIILQVFRLQILSAYLRECIETTHERNIIRELNEIDHEDFAAIDEWIEVFEAGQSHSDIAVLFTTPQLRQINTRHGTHQKLKRRFPSDRKINIRIARRLLAAMRRWAGNSTAGRGGPVIDEDPWNYQVDATLAVQEIGQRLIPYLIRIAEMERSHCTDPVSIYLPNSRPKVQRASSNTGSGSTGLAHASEIPRPEVQALVAAWNTLANGPKRTRFAGTPVPEDVIRLVPSGLDHTEAGFWFAPDGIYVRPSLSQNTTVAWIEIYLVEEDGTWITDILIDSAETDAGISIPEGVYLIHCVTNSPENRLENKLPKQIEWAGEGWLDGGRNKFILLIAKQTS